MNSVKLIVDAQALIGEGPCWDPDKKILYWVDIIGKKLHIFNPRENVDRVIYVNEYVSSVVVRESGGLLLTTQNGINFFDIKEEMMIPILNPEIHLKNNRFNDGKCDPAGRFWAGTMDFNGQKNCGSLYRLNHNLEITKVKEKVSISNGIAWSPNDDIMYYVDSPTRQVVAFDYDNESGKIDNERVVIKFEDKEGIPDGVTTDMEGKIWIAHWGGSKVTRWNPEIGKLLEVIPIPVLNVSSCVFGGEKMNELYITTSRLDLNKNDLEIQPLAGGVFRLDTNIVGTQSYKFKG
ncbi:SMP-30/gluconolactonase/LRE family protein [Virgibacillus sp. W0430]|uniref:SMP-30/gluconolactonase/LRE family protein n=1 Tax=Virgibacillus sp. W0430 TaxID=3391580 RepID=UPI003F46898D